MNVELIITKLENFIEDKNYSILVINWLNQLLKYNPRDCIVEYFENEVTLTWNKGNYYFNNEILLNGQVNWYFRDRLTGKVLEGLEFISDNFHSSEFQRLIKIATELKPGEQLACCENCARVANYKDLPTKEEWCNRERIVMKAKGVM